MIMAAIVAGIVVVFFAIVALQAPSFRIERSISMNAPAEVAFARVNDFHKWTAWSPWEKKDPDMQRTYEGPASGTGAIYTWSGNKNVGAGRMTIGESHPNSLIRIKLEFMKPFKATNTAEFAFHASGPQTQVTWSMSGKKNFMMKFFHLIMNMDKMIGPDFENGLARMKAVAEAGSGK